MQRGAGQSLNGGISMTSLRPEVRAFMRTAETLLSPASLGTGLTEEEREIIAMYGSTLAEKFAMPTSESWPEQQS
jgi:hypothetical protein